MVFLGAGTELETLLELDGEVFQMDNGFWVKFIAHKTPVNKHISHGIKYSLTLHDSYNQRNRGAELGKGYLQAQKYPQVQFY